MIIIQDTREKIGHKNHILRYFQKHNIKVIRKKLNVGDYAIEGYENVVVIDTKQNLIEFANNLFSDKMRFEKECIRAKNNNVLLIFLIEQKITTKQELLNWHSPTNINGNKFLNIQGWQIYNEMKRYSALFNCKFRFCHKNSTGKTIIKLLEKYINQRQE